MDAQETHVAIESRQSDGQRAIQQIEFGKLPASPCFALCQGGLRSLGFRTEFFLVKGPMQRRGKPHDVVFEDEVGRSLFDALDGGFLAQGPGYQEQGDVTASFPQFLERFHTRPVRKPIVRKDCVEVFLLQRPAKLLLIPSQDRKSTRLNSSHANISYA